MTRRDGPRRPRQQPAAVIRAEAVAELDRLYAQLPRLLCKGLCADSCHNPDASQLERDRIAERGVILPEPIPGRVWARMAAAAEATSADTSGNGPHPRKHRGSGLPSCPALGPLSTCTVYDVRPFVCRAFGAVVTNPLTPMSGPMMCDHGCIPEGVLSIDEYLRVLTDIERLSRLVTGVARTPGQPRWDGAP